MEIWFSTQNDGKLQEFRELLRALPLEIHSASEMSYFSSPPENGDTFVANARIKARALRSIKDKAWVVADDSGLVVAGLDGLPGVHSARYAGANARASENNAKLLKMMALKSADKRQAHFVCCLVAFTPEGEEIICEGQLTGEIAKVARGQNGFGYDPVFIPTGYDKTMAELSKGEKNSISHRAQAMAQLVEHLKSRL